MRIKITSLTVDDQEKALEFYTQVLGFQKKHDIPVGQYKWLTVISPEGRDDLGLALESNANPPPKTFQETIFAQSIPLAAFEVADIEKEYKRLKTHSVVFTGEPTQMGPSKSRSSPTPAET
jgi:catechol 2,3-dioxygenase-like lactoylglutathione lyase family enzyme